MTSEYQLTLPLIEHDSAPDTVKPILEEAERQVGFLPNLYKAMANVPGVLETYLLGYDRIRASESLTPAEQEVVFLTISRLNGCGYCMAAHSMLAEKASDVPPDVLHAIRNNQPFDNPRLGALSRFTTEMFESRGRPSSAEVKAFLDAGYPEHAVLDIILAMAVKTLSNYSNHLFHTPVDEMFSGYRWDG